MKAQQKTFDIKALKTLSRMVSSLAAGGPASFICHCAPCTELIHGRILNGWSNLDRA